MIALQMMSFMVVLLVLIGSRNSSSMSLLYPIFSHCLPSSLIILKILFFVGRRVRPASPVGQPVKQASRSASALYFVVISTPSVTD